MTKIPFDKMKDLFNPEQEFKALQEKAALKAKPAKTLSMDEARAYSTKLIEKWATEK